MLKAKRKKKINAHATPSRDVEKRLAAIESEVAQLRSQVGELTAKSWRRICGSMKNNPAFGEAMRLAAEIRRAD